MAIRILIADDHGVLRAGLRALLGAEPGLEVIGEAADGRGAVEQAGQLHPDVALLDISMPGLDGLQAIGQLRERSPNTRVLILTLHEDPALLREALRHGARGYIVKRAVDSELIDAIRAVCQGFIYVHPAMTRALLTGTMSPGPAPAEPLTPRERQVLVHIAQGYTNRQIAELLTISVRTVESHRANLMSKLSLRSRADVVRYARAHGYLA